MENTFNSHSYIPSRSILHVDITSEFRGAKLWAAWRSERSAIQANEVGLRLLSVTDNSVKKYEAKEKKLKSVVFAQSHYRTSARQ